MKDEKGVIMCLLCGERESEMEFNTITHQGMLIASICLECWGGFPGDIDATHAIVKKRQETAIGLFGLPGDIRAHWGDVPEDKRPVILSYLLRGVLEEEVTP